jgi:phosphoglycolate phosphatase
VIAHVLFDLDGTLIDSCDGILESLRRCIERAGLQPRIELTRQLVGPPLSTLIATAMGSSDPTLLTELEAAFRREYDRHGWLASRPYPGIGAALRALNGAGLQLHVVTNKRLRPTRRILRALGWSGTFKTVNTLDSCVAATSKTDIVARLLERFGVAGSSATLVGDSEDDAAAARGNGVAFAWASWGYGTDRVVAHCGVRLADARHLVRYVLGATAAPA